MVAATDLMNYCVLTLVEIVVNILLFHKGAHFILFSFLQYLDVVSSNRRRNETESRSLAPKGSRERDDSRCSLAADSLTRYSSSGHRKEHVEDRQTELLCEFTSDVLPRPVSDDDAVNNTSDDEDSFAMESKASSNSSSKDKATEQQLTKHYEPLPPLWSQSNLSHDASDDDASFSSGDVSVSDSMLNTISLQSRSFDRISEYDANKSKATGKNNEDDDSESSLHSIDLDIGDTLESSGRSESLGKSIDFSYLFTPRNDRRIAQISQTQVDCSVATRIGRQVRNKVKRQRSFDSGMLSHRQAPSRNHSGSFNKSHRRRPDNLKKHKSFDDFAYSKELQCISEKESGRDQCPQLPIRRQTNNDSLTTLQIENSSDCPPAPIRRKHSRKSNERRLINSGNRANAPNYTDNSIGRVGIPNASRFLQENDRIDASSIFSQKFKTSKDNTKGARDSISARPAGKADHTKSYELSRKASVPSLKRINSVRVSTQRHGNISSAGERNGLPSQHLLTRKSSVRMSRGDRQILERVQSTQAFGAW